MAHIVLFLIGFFMTLIGIGTAENEFFMGMALSIVGLLLMFANIKGINELDFSEHENNA